MQPITELVSDEYISKIWDEKVKVIEENGLKGMSLHRYFELQVGPKDATTIVNQMKTMFMNGYVEGFKVCQKFYTMT